MPARFWLRRSLAGLMSIVTMLAALPPALLAATEPIDLGSDLTYVRVHSFGESADAVKTAITAGHAAVIDLRYASTSVEDAATLGDALARRNTRAALLFLVSPQTPAALLPALSPLPPGALTLGIAGSRPAPAVVVAQPADLDRRAYDALDAGAKLEDLVSGKIEKERFDEASLVKEFKNGNVNAAPPASPDPSGKSVDEKAPALIDRVLQRAIHLHRALAALRSRG